MKPITLSALHESPTNLYLRVTHTLRSAVGVGGTDYVKPPSFAPAEGDEEKKPRFEQIQLPDGSRRITLDTIQSSANRMEAQLKPLIAEGLYPSVTVRVTVGDEGRTLTPLDLGHRCGDAMLRYSKTDKGEVFSATAAGLAIVEYKQRGVSDQFGRWFPESLLFGSWDSRGTQAKARRIVACFTEGENAAVSERMQQFAGNVPVSSLNTMFPGVKSDALSKHGLNPAVGSSTIAAVTGPITRVALVNLIQLRSVVCSTAEKTAALRAYLAALALYAVSHLSRQLDLREGCSLMPTGEPKVELLAHQGTSTEAVLPSEPELHDQLRHAAMAWFAGPAPALTLTFDPKQALSALKKGTDVAG